MGASSIDEVRLKLAGAVAHAARRLWRRSDRQPQDDVVLDLLCEGLARMGAAYRPDVGQPAHAALAAAPAHIRTLVSGLVPLARRPARTAPKCGLSPAAEVIQQSSSDPRTSIAEVLSASGLAPVEAHGAGRGELVAARHDGHDAPPLLRSALRATAAPFTPTAAPTWPRSRTPERPHMWCPVLGDGGQGSVPKDADDKTEGDTTAASGKADLRTLPGEVGSEKGLTEPQPMVFDFPLGSRVRIQGLTRCQRLNGQRGEVVREADEYGHLAVWIGAKADSGWWGPRIPGRDEIRISPSNLFLEVEFSAGGSGDAGNTPLFGSRGIAEGRGGPSCTSVAANRGGPPQASTR